MATIDTPDTIIYANTRWPHCSQSISAQIRTLCQSTATTKYQQQIIRWFEPPKVTCVF